MEKENIIGCRRYKDEESGDNDREYRKRNQKAEINTS